MNTNQPGILVPRASVDLSLVQRLRILMENARSSATRAGYDRDFRDYEAFCIAHGLPSMPPSPPAIALYLAHLSTRLRTRPSHEDWPQSPMRRSAKDLARRHCGASPCKRHGKASAGPWASRRR